MIKLPGIEIPSLNIDIVGSVGVLLFSEFPSTSLYYDKENEPILKEWVDCSDDGEINRYFYYKVSKQALKGFLEQKISHIDLINNCADGLLHFTDVHAGNDIKFYLLSSKTLPIDYQPNSDFYFNAEDGVDTNKVIDFFRLSTIQEEESFSNKLVQLSGNRNHETFNIHLLQSSGVGYGRINTDVLGRTLLKFEKFYKDLGLDICQGKNRGELKGSSKKDLLPNLSTETYGFIAASVSILLKPKASNFELFSEDSTSGTVATRIFNLISLSLDNERFLTEYADYSNFTISSYKEFLKEIYESSLNLELNWYNPYTSDLKSGKLNYLHASKIIGRIDQLNIESEVEFEETGKFREINCNTGHFTFESNKNEQYKGYFDQVIREGSERINFIDVYLVKFKRKILKEADRSEDKLLDKIYAFYKLSEETNNLPIIE